jgi:glycosyltransferase involved in cell wall biosynthesis
VKVLEISPYEPPASGWVKRVKVVREVIAERGGVCEVLDIGPSRKIVRPGCISVADGRDFLRKIMRFARSGYTFHCHINGQYFRGLLLALAACSAARVWGNRCVTTFHGGAAQPFLHGACSRMLGPLLRTIFGLSDAVICNSELVKRLLQRYGRAEKLFPIQAFSVQYLSYRRVALDPPIAQFVSRRSPVISTYLCFRPGFFLEVVIDSMAGLVLRHPDLGLVIVGTGSGKQAFADEVRKRGLERHFCLAGNLEHEALMTVLELSDVHLRTPTTDGVCATVLQALALRIPVVASENGCRPTGVVTYCATDALDLVRKMDSVLENRERIAASLQRPAVPDTAGEEVDLLAGDRQSGAASRCA